MESKWLSIILTLSSGGRHQPYLQMSKLHLREGLLILSTQYPHTRAHPSAHPSPRRGSTSKPQALGLPFARSCGHVLSIPVFIRFWKD